MEILTLVENLAYQQGTLGEHGLSFLVKSGSRQILFDTGQSDLLVHNAKKLNIDLYAVDAVVISHGHYDHTGGLAAFFDINDHAPVWIKPEAFEDKLSVTTGNSRFIGIDKDVVQKYRERFCFLTEQMEVAPGLIVVPQVNHYYSFEQSSSAMMVHKESHTEVDSFDDELFMLYNHPEGLTVFAGCAHRGIANICRTAIDVTANPRIRLVLGGTHLKGASKGRIEKTVEAFGQMAVERYGLCHCTGLPAFMAFSDRFEEQVRYAHVGTHFSPYD